MKWDYFIEIQNTNSQNLWEYTTANRGWSPEIFGPPLNSPNQLGKLRISFNVEFSSADNFRNDPNSAAKMADALDRQKLNDGLGMGFTADVINTANVIFTVDSNCDFKVDGQGICQTRNLECEEISQQ